MSLTGFNLLQNVDTPPDVWDKVYDWVTKVGRTLIMIVEVTVIIAFVSRIIIDTQTKNLTERVTADSQQLVSFKIKEGEFRDDQSRFIAYKTIWNGNSTYSQVLQDVITVLPPNIPDLTMSIRDNIITIDGTGDINAIGTFETTLKNNTAEFDDVQVIQVQDKLNTKQATFGIKLTVKQALLVKRNPIGTVTTNSSPKIVK